jgi:hypothetical protein
MWDVDVLLSYIGCNSGTASCPGRPCGLWVLVPFAIVKNDVLVSLFPSGKNSMTLSAANSNLTITTVLSYSRQLPDRLFTSFPLHLAKRLSPPTSATANATFQVFSMFFSRLTPATPAPEDPYTALPPVKSRRRIEPPTPLNLDTNQNHRGGRLSSGVAGGWGLKEEYEGGKPGEEKRGKEREQGGKRRSRDILGWSISEVGVPGKYCRSVLVTKLYTQLQEGEEVCVQEGRSR